jgi:hypothetical protein
MNDRERAISILRQARDALAARLTERVLEAAEEIASEAAGESYLSEIDELYDRLGSKLHHISVMLTHLPADPSSLDRDAGAAQPGEESETREVDTAAAKSAGGVVSLPAPRQAKRGLPAPGDDAAGDEPISFRDFAAQIQAGDVEAAGRSLAELFEVDGERGLRCALFFFDAASRDEHFFAKAMSLRRQLAGGSINSALMLLYQCFGLQPYESIGVVQSLKTRLV